MFKSNISPLSPLPVNAWRKVALAAWNNPNDPVIYSRVLLNPEPALAYLEKINTSSSTKITLTHYLGKVCGILLHKHPVLNSSILFYKAHTRKTSDIFFHISVIDEKGQENLSGFKVKNCAMKSLESIASELNQSNQLIKKGHDVTFLKIKQIMRILPHWLTRFAIRTTTFIQYRLNLWSPLLGTQQDTFGSHMITNIGSLGIDEAFVPFSSYTNVTSIVALGRIIEAPVIRNNQVVPGKIQYACWTLDHRIIDGSSAAFIQNTFRSVFENPQLIEDFDRQHS